MELDHIRPDYMDGILRFFEPPSSCLLKIRISGDSFVHIQSRMDKNDTFAPAREKSGFDTT